MEEQLERERKNLREARTTISNLIAHISEYKKVIEEERSGLDDEVSDRNIASDQINS